ncbi:MAG TPA: cache domain-containing protein [Candidatus Sumerlaeota bacterium]|nr:cache domain-containing protein [Candidatus Sumerlaeota bacterium]
MAKTFFCVMLLCLAALSGNLAAQDAPAVPAPPSPASFKMDGQYSLNGMISLTETHLNSLQEILEALAMTENVRSGDWDRMKDILAFVEKREMPSLVWYARPDGSYYAVGMGLTDKSLKDREYFPKVLAGEMVLGALVISHATGKKSVIVAVPVRDGEKVTGVLGASVFLEDLSRVVKAQMTFPDDIVFFALDSMAQTTLSWKGERIFLDPTAQGSESMTRAVKEMLSGDQGEVGFEFEGRTRRMLYRKSPALGWSFAVGEIVNP